MATLPYVASGFEGLQLFNVINPNTPLFLTSRSTYYAHDVDIANNMAYVADGPHGLKIYDVTSPATPNFMGSYSNMSNAMGVDSHGTRVMVADDLSGLRIINVLNPYIPRMISRKYISSGRGYAVAAELRRIYLATGTDGLHIYQIDGTYNDFDGDDHSDLGVAGGGNWHIRKSTDGGMFRGGEIPVSDSAFPVCFDTDGNGYAETIYYNPDTGRWVTSFSNGASISLPWGWSETVPVPGDYDNDAIRDIAVYHPAGGQWYIRNSSGGSEFVSWGWSGALPIYDQYYINRWHHLAPW